MSQGAFIDGISSFPGSKGCDTGTGTAGCGTGTGCGSMDGAAGLAGEEDGDARLLRSSSCFWRSVSLASSMKHNRPAFQPHQVLVPSHCQAATTKKRMRQIEEFRILTSLQHARIFLQHWMNSMNSIEFYQCP